MTCALVITTYNWKEALHLVLLSTLNQSVLPNEIIIADDGSREDTKELINAFKLQTDIEIIHSWQRDEGFRAALSRNRAISQVKSEYVILIDGDMILHREFIKEHLQFAREGFFIQGSRVLLGKSISKTLLDTKNIKISFWQKDITNRLHALHSNFLATLFLRSSMEHRGIKTCNLSFFKKDCYLVNGFNNDFIGWGREDSEFVARLYHNGIQRLNLKFHAIAYHIWHNENSRKSLEKNDLLLQETLNSSLKSCANGICQLEVE